MRRDERRRAEPRPARAGARVEGRQLRPPLVGVALAAALAGAACRGGEAKAPAATDGCKAIAVHGRALIDAAPASERDLALRPVVGAIDLCQHPGLVAASKECVLAASSLAALRACPLVTEDTAQDDPNLSCDAAVEHAMALLKVDGSRPRTRAGRAHARAAYTDGCAALNLDGRRCVIEARTMSAIDECFADAGHLREGA